ncbi:unnamed protein product [Spirodela intermedia]|uniref:Uncharacterized protein n=1 Tax=Spirodela intermedia TaxID=51605 RepID=A0A7I8L210_SPIIN|nr:unnamed protein product [Spirodela intermedia]
MWSTGTYPRHTPPPLEPSSSILPSQE